MPARYWHSTATAAATTLSGGTQGRTLEEHGFELASIDPSPIQSPDIDLYDPEAMNSHLYPAARASLRRAFPGCSKVLVFDHILRNPGRYREVAGARAQ